MSHASINEVVMDNTGRGPIQVPGFGGIPVEYELTCKDRFAHGADDWKQVPAVTAREFAMVAVMNTLTDKPEWQVNIFDDEVVALWREEAFATTPLMSEKAWTWCLAELRDKAVYFKENQYIRVLDTGSCICKSDTLIPESLGSEFRSGIVPLLEQQDKDWQFESEEQVLNLVQPSLFPLVYGRSLALEAGGQVDLDNVFGFYEKAEVAPKHFDRRVDFDSIAGRKSKVESYHWSSNFQWLPCEVEFLVSLNFSGQTSLFILVSGGMRPALFLDSLRIEHANSKILTYRRNLGQTCISPLISTTYILLINRYTEASRSLSHWQSNRGMTVLFKGSKAGRMYGIEDSEGLSRCGL